MRDGIFSHVHSSVGGGEPFSREAMRNKGVYRYRMPIRERIKRLIHALLKLTGGRRSRMDMSHG